MNGEENKKRIMAKMRRKVMKQMKPNQTAKQVMSQAMKRQIQAIAAQKAAVKVLQVPAPALPL